LQPTLAEVVSPSDSNKQVLPYGSSKLNKVNPPIDSHPKVLLVRRLLLLGADPMQLLQMQLHLIALQNEAKGEQATAADEYFVRICKDSYDGYNGKRR
jgi:hypothetical protein